MQFGHHQYHKGLGSTPAPLTWHWRAREGARFACYALGDRAIDIPLKLVYVPRFAGQISPAKLFLTSPSRDHWEQESFPVV